MQCRLPSGGKKGITCQKASAKAEGEAGKAGDRTTILIQLQFGSATKKNKNTKNKNKKKLPGSPAADQSKHMTVAPTIPFFFSFFFFGADRSRACSRQTALPAVRL